jgi:poly(A) polymerase
MAAQVTVVSVERIAQELRLTLVLPGRVRAAKLLRESGILRSILPEVAATCDSIRSETAETWWNFTLRVLAALTNPGFSLALAALLQAVGRTGVATRDDVESAGKGAELALAIARRWKLSNDELQQVVWLVRNQFALRGAAHQPWPKLQRLLILTDIHELLALHEALATADDLPTADAWFCRERLAWPAEMLNPPPLVTGNDLIASGIQPGPGFARLLEAVRDAQLEGAVQTKAEALAWIDRTWPARSSAAGRENRPSPETRADPR